MTGSDAPAGVGPVVTLFETSGSLMDRIGLRLGELLGVPVVGPSLTPDAVALALDPEAGTNDAFERLLQNLGPDAVVDAALSNADLDAVATRIDHNTRTVRNAARAGGVILGRNAAFILRDWPNAFHVMLDGSWAERVNRASEASDYAAEREALRMQLEDDVRTRLAVFAYGYDPRGLEHYDLVVNTCRLDVEQASRVIASALCATDNLAGDGPAQPSRG
ncbi:hypothetical protein GCM10009785_24600 [Brooklawnia cerclae]|uniref:Cytidylate kinase n=1 Tax=Brooklawnia cerclae TaxID=349934 RepID=A0ABX0SB04_9ACTN|nr:cytidylate kinase family protein [Brooklawnia cerclae]NIH55577.1 cytidylate kinase [Brooklawnia cerclae]